MKNIILLFLLISFLSSTHAQYNYPPTKTVDSNETYFGVTYKDPYRWLEYRKAPDAETWFRQQATYTDSILNNLNGRDELIEDWKRLDKLKPTKISNLVYENGRIFYRKTLPGENVGKIYYRQGMEGPERLLFDPTALIPGKTITVERFKPSHDGKMIGIVYAKGGAEMGTLIIMNVDTKQILKDSVSSTLNLLSWTFDDKAFLYFHAYNNPTANANKEDDKIRLHIIGTDLATDADFFSNASYPGLNVTPATAPTYALLDEGSKDYILAGHGNMLVPATLQYYTSIEQLRTGNISWKTLCTYDDSIENNEVLIDDMVYAISFYNAPNRKVLATSLKHPDWQHAFIVAAEKPDLIVRDLIRTKDFLMIRYSDGMNNYLSKYNFRTKFTSNVKLPYPGYMWLQCLDPKTNKCILTMNSWVKPSTSYDYDAETDAIAPGIFNLTPVYPEAYKELQSEDVQVKGHDGVMIPLTIIYKKGMKKDGSNICLLYGYGAYGENQVPYFQDIRNSLAVRGVVIAIAHVRGGGEKGEAWHKAGMKTNKPNTWKDFISCAEYMITNGYTSPQKMAGEGVSAGGILISRAITKRPDLFAAAICNVGAANVMRLFRSIEEFGTVKDSVECRGLYEMDGVQHVANGTKYPAVICVAGWNDPRVPVWQLGKFAGALQNASISGKPVLMKVNYDNGHFTEDKNVTFANFADQYAFILWQCGDPGFQPKKYSK
jgi:prolyl oligopeptidase